MELKQFPFLWGTKICLHMWTGHTCSCVYMWTITNLWLFFSCPAHTYLYICMYKGSFLLHTPWLHWLVNAVWTVYKRQEKGVLGKDACNMWSVMCSVIDMLTLVFQAAASKPRLAALIQFSGICGCTSYDVTHTVVSSICLKMPLFALCLKMKISAG